MKQADFCGFGPSDKSVTEWRAPANLSDDIVTLCMAAKNPEAAAVAHSLRLARARFGFSQEDIAIRCGWKSATYLSEIAKGRKAFPTEASVDRAAAFVRATGCNLLEQVRQRQRIQTRLAGKESENDVNRAVLAAMMRELAA